MYQIAAALAPLLEGIARGRAGCIDRAGEAPAAARSGYDQLYERHRDESVFGLSPRRRLFLEGRLRPTCVDWISRPG